MTHTHFIETLDKHYAEANKMGAVKFLLDTKLVGGLKESKFFIDDYWFPTRSLSAGQHVFDNLSTKQVRELEKVEL